MCTYTLSHLDKVNSGLRVTPGPPEFRVVDPAEPQPLPIEEFVDSIDSRGGYFQGVVKSIHDFQEELTGAVKSVVETKDFIVNRAKERRIPVETIKQLVSVLSFRA
jgi:hypothetical protein